jgi:hypothetical protein
MPASRPFTRRPVPTAHAAPKSNLPHAVRQDDKSDNSDFMVNLRTSNTGLRVVNPQGRSCDQSEKFDASAAWLMPPDIGRSLATRPSLDHSRTDTAMKMHQSNKIRELGEALIQAGLLTLDEQAEALGLCRSTTWTILQANHKASGLSASVINQMLASPKLPPCVRATIVEYVEEKAAGRYGHSEKQIRRFRALLSIEPRRASMNIARIVTRRNNDRIEAAE